MKLTSTWAHVFARGKGGGGGTSQCMDNLLNVIVYPMFG